MPRVHLADAYHDFAGLSPHNQDLRVVDGRIRPGDEPRRTKVCLYGAGLYKDQAPLDDPEWEVWALNLVPPLDEQNRLRADVWFDLHQRVAQTADDLRWMAACPFPLYVPDDLLDASPNAVRFPLAEIEAALGSYWTCTFALQIALILHQGIASDIGLYGVELAYGTQRERTVEYACTSYWLGRAEERGLRIHLPAHSCLGRSNYRYGFEYQAEIDDVKQYVALMRHYDPATDVAGSLPLPLVPR